MTVYVLAVDMTEEDGICLDCPNGPHLHVVQKDLVSGALALNAIMDSKVVRQHFDLAVARAVEAELARRGAEEDDE